MEKTEEIKGEIKQRIVELMAEQITKEEGFIDLKLEIIGELFNKRNENYSNIKSNITREQLFKKLNVNHSNVKSEPTKDLDTFSFMVDRSENSLQKAKDKQADKNRKIINIKLGKDKSKFADSLIKTLEDTDSTSYLDVIQELSGKRIPDYNEFIIDPRLKTDFSEEKKQELINSSLKLLKEVLINPFSSSLEVHVDYYSNEENYRKEYSVFDKNKNFRFKCFYVYNKTTNSKLIDEISVDSKGFLLSGGELGVSFAIEAMNLVDQAENNRQEAIKTMELNSEEKVNLIDQTENNQQEAEVIIEPISETPDIN